MMRRGVVGIEHGILDAGTVGGGQGGRRSHNALVRNTRRELHLGRCVGDHEMNLS